MRALDPFRGEKKWEFPYTSPPWRGAVSGKQYVAIPAGAGLFAFALPEK